jgi:hypothetical protein
MTPMKKGLTKTYSSLLAEISTAYESARRVVVKTYWEIGRLIVENEEASPDRAVYGMKILRRISRDLTGKYGKGFSVTNLKAMRKFYVNYQIGQAPDQLPWTHYQLLSTLEDEAARKAIEKRAIRESLSSRELEALVIDKKKLAEKDAKKRVRLTVTRGSLWTYVVHDSVALPENKSRVLIDCGFNVLSEYAKEGDFKKGDCVSIDFERSLEADIVLKKVPQRSIHERFLFLAYVEKIIDGDTLWVYINTGMGVWVREKLRLRGIDTPELKVKDGQRAKLFVIRALAECPFIIVKTVKSDKYDRYLADIFYRAGATDPEIVAAKGNYLNQDLLDADLAEPV